MLEHDASPCRQQSRVEGSRNDDEAFSLRFKFYRDVNDALALAALVAFVCVLLLACP